MANQTDLMGIFNNLATRKVPVRAFNTYRGLPFNHFADILSVDKDVVAARVHRHQAVSMAAEGRTHLQGDLFSEVIRANVLDVDFRKKQVVLNDFTGVGDSVGKRMAVRVQPGECVDAQITDGRRCIRGRIADLSTNGMCVFTFSTSLYALSFGLDKEVFIDFKPPRFDTTVRFLGVITNVRQQEGSYLHRLGLRIFPSPEIQPLLDDFITWQVQAILREVELTYHSMCYEKPNQV